MKALKFVLGFILFFAMAIVCRAEPNQGAETAAAPIETVLPIEAPRARTNYLASISYSPVDLPIPSKLGLTVGLVKSQYQTWEIEYMKGGISVPGGFRDLASVNDVRVGLIGRSFYGNSLHVSYGVSYFDFSATVGDALMNGLTNGNYPNIDAMTVQGVGFNVGLGSSWVFKHDITLGVDWITWAQPLFITKKSSDYLKYSTNEDNKKTVEDTMSVVSYLPRFALLSVHVGMLF